CGCLHDHHALALLGEQGDQVYLRADLRRRRRHWLRQRDVFPLLLCPDPAAGDRLFPVDVSCEGAVRMRISIPLNRIRPELTSSQNRVRWEKLRSFLFGSRTSYGLVTNVLLYMVLIAIGFVYLYPLLFMFVTSLKSPGDLLNPMVQWIPSEVYAGNYEKAYRVLNYPQT